MLIKSKILGVTIIAFSFLIFGMVPVWAQSMDWDRGFCFVGNNLNFFPGNEMISGIGDINNDGVPDILAGTSIQAGRYVILSGADGSVLRDVPSPVGDHQGVGVAAYGDYDADGIPDYLVGAQFADPGGRASAGEVRLFSGADGSILQTFEGPVANEMIGYSIVTVGDVDADGIADVAVGAAWADGNGVSDGGKIYLFSGASGVILWTSTEGAIYEDDNYGINIDVVGDVNADGKPDIITGSRGADDRFDPAPTRWAAVGEVRIISGADGTTIHYFTLTDNWGNGRIGNSVTGLGGDVNADGVPDAAFSADFWDHSGTYTGDQIVLVSGADGSIIRIIDQQQLWDASGVSGFSFTQGWDLDGLGDVDEDGLPDIVAGVVSFGWGGFGQGALAVYSSATGCLLAILDSDLPQTTSPREQLGRAAAAVGDLDGDGVCDVAGGAMFYTAPGEDSNGRLCVFHLKPQPNQPPVCDANGPYNTECQGVETLVQLDGTASSDPDSCDTLTFTWTTDCPAGNFNDATSPTPTLSVDSSDGCFACNVQLTVTDRFGESNNCSTTVTILDTTPPEIISCPGNTTIECDESADPANTGTATATDVCDPSPVVTFSDVTTPSTCLEEFTITRTWTATDACGNTSSCVQIISVVDTTPPVIDCNAPANITPPDAPVSFTAVATDNCDDDPSVEITGYDCFKYTKKDKRIDKTESCVVEVAGDTITILDSGGVNDHITWTIRATDSCGNVAERECEVVVVNPNEL